MSTTILSIVGLVFLGALTGAFWRLVGVLSHRNPMPEPAPYRVPPMPRNEWRAEVEADMERLKIAVSEGIARVDRHEKRVAKTVTSARRLVREAGLEHAGIEAEYEELQPAHDEGVEPLPPMSEEVEAPRAVRIPGGHLEIGVA